MHVSRRLKIAGVIAGLMVAATATSVPAMADPVGGLLVNTSGSGLIMTATPAQGLTSVSICAQADLWINGSETNGLQTSVAVTAQGLESYAGVPGGTPTSSQPLTGENEQLTIGGNRAIACVPFALHPYNSTVSVSFEIVGSGSGLTGSYAAVCEGTAARALSGNWIVVAPCD